MEPDKARNRKLHRDGYELAEPGSERSRRLQRKILQQQTEASASASSSAHGEDSDFDMLANPPEHDRAG